MMPMKMRRMKRAMLNGLETLKFSVSSKRPLLLRKFKECRSDGDLFAFAATHIGIDQKREEFKRFLAYVQKMNPQSICEIGVNNGGMNFMLANSISSCRTIVGIDLFLLNVHQLRLFVRKGVVQHFVQGDSAEDRTFQRVAALFGGQPKIDLLFIDGDHSYKGVVADFRYRCLVRDGGIIAFHDICMDHRRRYGTETPSYAGEVYLFWRKLRDHFDSAEFFTSEDQNGAGIGTITWNPSKSLDAIFKT